MKSSTKPSGSFRGSARSGPTTTSPTPKWRSLRGALTSTAADDRITNAWDNLRYPNGAGIVLLAVQPWN